MALLEEAERIRIPFGDIREATKNFTTLIGKGGYGLVYKGELLLSGKLTTVAVKRLQVSLSGQGFKEFLTEIQLLTRYKHPNLISLVGFCYEGEEKILIYEYAEHGSLDKYLSTLENRRALTWKRRLNICVNAARGLNYLHNEASTNERVIHRDIKSANVLLDQNWKAMISDFGLSKLGRANEKDTYLITNASGTYVYCDPVYTKSGILTKESDVYSFGVVLFEVLCGRLCVIDVHNEHRFLPQLAQSYYKKGQINEIMDVELQNQLDSNSLKKFSEIAFKCIHNTRKQRPSMRWVLKKLEEIKSEMNPMLNPRATGPELSSNGIPGSNQGSNNSTLKGWPLTGLDQLRSGLKEQQKSFMRASQPFHQPRMLSPNERLLLLKMVQIQQQQQLQNSNQQQQQIHHSLSAPPPQNSNLNFQQEKIVGVSVGDGSMSNPFRGNDQISEENNRKRKQHSTSGPANSTPTMMYGADETGGHFSSVNQLDNLVESSSKPSISSVPALNVAPLLSDTMNNGDQVGGATFEAISGSIRQNNQILDQIAANMSSMKLQDNINLFSHTKNNIATILNKMRYMPSSLQLMPPLPVSLNEDLATSIETGMTQTIFQ